MMNMNELEDAVCSIVFHWWLEENGLLDEWLKVIQNE